MYPLWIPSGSLGKPVVRFDLQKQLPMQYLLLPLVLLCVSLVLKVLYTRYT